MRLEDMRGRAGDAVTLDDTPIGAHEILEGLGLAPLDPGGNDGGHRPAERFRRHDCPVPGDNAAIFQAAHALNHRRTRETDSLCKRLHRKPAVVLKLSKNTLVDLIDMTHAALRLRRVIVVEAA